MSPLEDVDDLDNATLSRPATPHTRIGLECASYQPKFQEVACVTVWQFPSVPFCFQSQDDAHRRFQRHWGALCLQTHVALKSQSGQENISSFKIGPRISPLTHQHWSICENLAQDLMSPATKKARTAGMVLRTHCHRSTTSELLSWPGALGRVILTFIV
jgi:hypothetical protein